MKPEHNRFPKECKAYGQVPTWKNFLPCPVKKIGKRSVLEKSRKTRLMFFIDILERPKFSGETSPTSCAYFTLPYIYTLFNMLERQ